MLDIDTHRIRRGVARRAERLLDRLGLIDPKPQPPLPPIVWPARQAPEPSVAPAPVDDAPVGAAASTRRPLRTPAAEVSPPPPPAAAPEPEPEPAPHDGPALDPADVEELLDDMVRPALQADGGDIQLVKVEGGDVYVELVGACHACPSSVLTMKMGVERLLEEELPAFRRLIQVNAASFD